MLVDTRRLASPLCVVLCVVIFAALGCTNPADTSLPIGTVVISDLTNEKGALGAYQATLIAFRKAITESIAISGLLTDEYRAEGVGLSAATIGATGDAVDERVLPEDAGVGSRAYTDLHVVRNQGAYAAAALEKYSPEQPIALRGQLDALRGYAELLLADLYCSGVPLSTTNFEADYTFQPGSTTDAVYAHAITLFDSALALSVDSARFLNLARIGRGRALLARGEYENAAAAVVDVPMGFRYTFVTINVSGDNNNFARGVIGDREGGTGLPYISSRDPRTTVTQVGTTPNGLSIDAPDKYPVGLQGAPSTVVVADWIEARLIVAEAALRRGNTGAWLDTLNMLRATVLDSTGAPALAPLIDPGSAASRLALLFDERGYWLFLTAHRQGDLRRRVRADHLSQSVLYPTGIYFGGGGQYGADVTLPIPSTERQNPLFTGCQDRNA